MTTNNDRALYLKWKEKRDAVQAEQRQHDMERMDRLTHDTEAQLARVIGDKANDGKGRCKWCGIVLGRDGEIFTHPALRECPGPPPDPCTHCGGGYTRSESGRWVHTCKERRTGAPRAQQLERVQQGKPGENKNGIFGYRRESEE